MRDVNKISCQATLEAIRDTSNEYETESDDYDERMDNWGYTQEELNTLLSCGIKPWEDEADGFLEWLEDQRRSILENQ